ncbi:serine hydrolase domain-containing protein [Actinosynnema sp. NPDC020468]|uniref:serine hydrolase domain-containing protein n=1 Tax=Actinosynnema sp. NPDC020468 TaxID=3154488 RepID=UPI0033FB7380
MTKNLQELRALLDEWAREAEVPGIAVGVLQDGEESVLATGVSSVDAPTPVDGDTLFMVGSTSKTFTAAAVLVLVEDGLLNLDEPVVTYLPDLPLADPTARATVTLRHLLTHTGGFLGDVDLDNGWDSDGLAEAVAGFGDLPQVFPTGEVFSYSNSGFVLAGRVLEVVSGTSYEDLVRTRLLEPLGMTDSHFLPWDVLTRHHTVGHTLVPGGTPVVAHTLGLPRSVAAAGGLWSSARDQLRWARFFLLGESTGAAPLGERARTALWEPQRRAALPYEQVALSWLRTRYGDAELVRHGGNVSNLQVSEFVTLPDQRFAVTVLTNSRGGGVVGPRVVDWCLENLAGVPPIPAAPVLPRTPEQLADYTGRYETGGLAFDFTAREDALWARMLVISDPDNSPPAFEVAFVAEDVVARAADTRRATGGFVRDARGRVTAVEFGGRTARRQEVAPA